jgi:GNS1/SUR4 family
MQIAQFVVGTTFALGHLFIGYKIPVSVPYIYSLADLTSGLASDVSTAASIATASASAGIGSWLKKVAFRAAGEEGLAENVRNEQGKPFGIDALHAAKDLKAREETRYRDEMRMVHCIDTSGQAFAILINCIYLAPLTWLFVRFFVRSYTTRGQQQGTSGRPSIGESSKDAARDVKREVDRALNEHLGSTDDENGTAKPSGEDADRAKNKQGLDEKRNGGKSSGENGNEKEESGQKGAEDSTKQDDEKNFDANSGEDKDLDARAKSGDEDAKTKSEDKPSKAESEADNKAEEKADKNQADADADDKEQDDIEILDSAEAVTDILDEGLDKSGEGTGE